MIKTLRLTSVVAVIFAGVVLASVLGYVRPDSFLHLSSATGGDKQTEKILGGPSAVERFKMMYADKVPTSEDKTPLLVKQAELLASILNPPARVDETPRQPSFQPPKPVKPGPRPPAAVSTKFTLLGTSYSSNPKMSYAYIRLPDNTLRWAGVGDEIGHVTIKEIRSGSIVCWDGGTHSEIPVEATPDPSSLLETKQASPEPTPTILRPRLGTGAPDAGTRTGESRASAEPFPSGSDPAQTVGIPVRPTLAPPVASSPAAVPATSPSAAQMSREEQENLSQLGTRLRNGLDAEAADREALANKLISEYKSPRSLPPGIEAMRNAGAPSDQNNPYAGQDSARDELRRQYRERLTLPRSAKN